MKKESAFIRYIAYLEGFREDEAGQDSLANHSSQIVYHVFYPEIILLS